MRRRTGASVAWSLAGLIVTMVLVSVFLGVASGIPEGEVFFAVFFPIFLAGFAALGALIAGRQPQNVIGWIFLGVGLLWALSIAASEFARYYAVATGEISWPVRTADWLGTWLFLPGIYVPVTFLFLLFPNGKLPSRRWRPVAWLSVAGIGLIAAASALGSGQLEEAVVIRSNPYAVGSEALWDVLEPVAWITGFAGMIGSVVALVTRFRRSSGEERLQLKWLAFAGVVVTAVFLGTSVGWVVAAQNDTLNRVVLPAVILLALFLIPVTASVGILKYRLYDIDVVISKTVIYGLLAAFVTIVYVAVVVGIGALVGSRGNLLLSIVATAVIALAFQPVRQWARHLANRLVYGKRATPYEVLSELAHGVGGNYSAEDVLPRMASIVGQGTGAARAEVWLRVGRDLRPAASWPEDASAGKEPIRLVGGDLPPIPGAARAIPVEHQGELLGALAMSMPRGEAFTPTNEKLVRDVASQAGLVLRNVRLIEELRASRQRLVTAQDEERRRLERNVHDGAQQQLVALSVKMRLLKTLTRKDPGKAEELVDQLQDDARDALDDLRDLARGIYPPLLADRGLAAALEAQARKAPIPVEVDPNGVGRYRQEAEATAYFCVLEALQNVAKYAGASRAAVGLREEDGFLVFSVSDDGRGFDVASTTRGSGLQNMMDRVEAVGGRIKVDSTPGRGTTVTGRVPVPG
jgi:signal transduction histidine kinase